MCYHSALSVLSVASTTEEGEKMKMAEFGVEYLFHPVGQGLFASGRLLSQEKEIFNWVYDCGSMSIKTVEKAINNFQIEGDIIDLLAISHFDKDHVSGVIKLIEKHEVDTIFLPYLALPIRILQAVQSEGEISLEYTEFILDPVAFLTRIARGRIRQIVFALPNDRDESLGEGAPERDPEDKEAFIKAKLIFDPADKTEEILEDLNLNVEESEKISVKFTQKIFWVVYNNRVIWEFIPHNDAKLAKNISPKFPPPEISEKINQFKEAKDEISRKDILEKIRAYYEKEFGKTKRNEISLFLYGGLEAKQETGLIRWYQFPSNHYFGGPFARNFCCFYGECVFCRLFQMRHPSKIAILYTGDGNLRKRDGTINENYGALRKRLTRKRLGQLLALQAPHHGAIGNWPLGLADEINLDFSVFSAGSRNHYGHPHQDVLNDFKKTQIVKVDERVGLFLRAWFEV